MVQHAIDEVTVSGKTGIIPIFDMVVGHFVAAAIGNLADATRFIISSAGQKFVPDLAVGCYPKSNIGMAR